MNQSTGTNAKEKAKFWNDRVLQSVGNSFFIPEEFQDEFKEIERLRHEFNSKAVEMAQKEITLNMATQNFFFKLRQHVGKSTMPDIWVKEVGMDAQALDDGFFIVNARDKGQR